MLISMSIDKVIMGEADFHKTDKRAVFEMLFSPLKNKLKSLRQVRIIKTETEDELGGHWREYGEIYAVIGKATFSLQDIDTKEKANYEIETGQVIYIPPKVALKVYSKPNQAIICCSESEDRENKTHKYKIE